jgi:hypothetical protein
MAALVSAAELPMVYLGVNRISMVTTRLARDDFLYLIAGGFGIARERLAKGSLLQNIIDFIIAMQRIGRRPILILDEAQNLNFEALEELRMLSNVVFDKEFALANSIARPTTIPIYTCKSVARTTPASGLLQHIT